jgi:glycosyltransferase involved in cell wall biosynthesis
MDWCDWFGRGGSVEERPSAAVRLVLRPVETFFEERFRTGAEGTTVINSVLRQRAVELGVPPESIFHLPNGSNVEEIRPVPLAEARKRLGWSLHSPVVGYIGAIFERDAKLMARSFDQIHHQEPGARLVLAGYCNIPVEELVRDPTVVVRTGPIPYHQVGHYLSACNVCWLPLADSGANRGRYPLKLNDYMAAGRPVVATDVGDVPELIHRGRFGLVTRDRPDELAEAVITLFRAPEKAEEMGRRARLLAEDEFTWDKVSDSLLSFYRRVLIGSV